MGVPYPYRSFFPVALVFYLRLWVCEKLYLRLETLEGHLAQISLLFLSSSFCLDFPLQLSF